MPKTKSRRKPKLRVATERSDPYTDRNMRKVAPAHQRMRNAKNRIHELEQQIAKLSVTGKGVTIAFELSEEAHFALTQLAKTGLFGVTPELTAAEMLTRMIRHEMSWLATGTGS